LTTHCYFSSSVPAYPNKGGDMKGKNTIQSSLWVTALVAGICMMLTPVFVQAHQVEPLAGGWKTWVLTSGSQLRLPPPSLPILEIAQLRAFEAQRDPATLDIINFWDAGSPAYRWIEMTYPLASGATSARPLALLSVAIYDSTIAAWDSKY